MRLIDPLKELKLNQDCFDWFAHAYAEIINRDDISKDKVKVQSINKKIKSKARDKQEFKNKNIGFFSYIFIFLISIIALFLIAETFKYQINNIFPNFGNYIIHVYETLNNILILIKDLFKSY